MTALVIPVKRLFQAKTRLAGVCTPGQRQSLCLDMLRHMLRTAEACSLLDLSAVVSPDEQLRALLALEFPAVRFLPDPGDLNQAAMTASRTLASEGFSTMLFALGDLPLLTSEELDQALLAGQEHPLVLLPDRHGKGTNGIILSPPDLLPSFSFGADSLAAHKAAAAAVGLTPAVLHIPGFAWDVDTPDDLISVRSGAHLLQAGRK
ncbi:2-phospho-L-lactate guanylyltransferase [uncultured Pseudoflavonifractor sp.]|uniref:2-phospho-L-lactate guanylyltransferase n=1 Tax=uncultured Pseudoflavonifractor sp. TaxID=1221379 RepID=UPI0025F5CA55|nr:2-phospho-L-lactate guanylyltransferase [uncultured Pseudoflavonifractor sp.]